MHVHQDTVYRCCEPLSSFQSRQVSLIVQSTVAVHLFFFLSKQTGLPHCTVYSCCAPLSSFQSRQVSLIVQSTVAVHLFLPFKADRSPSLYSLQLLCTSFFLSKQTGLLTVQSTVNIAVTVYCCCALSFFLSKQTGLPHCTVYSCCAPLSSFQSRQVSLFVQSTVAVHLFLPFKAHRSPHRTVYC